jgi:acetoin utilization protein AcuB
VNLDVPLKKIEEMMESRNIRHILVIEKEELLGIISDRDVKKYRSLFAETKASKEIDEATLEFKAHQIMSHDPITIYEDALASDAIKLMLENYISCLPVRNDDNDVIGIITSSDFMKWMVKFLEFME